LREAVEGASVDHVRREAHRIKGAGRMVGAHQVSTLAAQLEAAAAANDDWTALRATAADLDAAMARVMSALATADAAG
jgi:two-component system sensor histidine kinase EvgS